MCDDFKPDDDQLAIPSFLKRDSSTNRAAFMTDSETDTEIEKTELAPAKTKVKAASSNGHDKAPVKAKGKAKAKATMKPAKVKTAPKATKKAAKAIAKAKAAKPKAKNTAERDLYGLRKDSIKSKAASLYARKSGATLEEVKEVLGSVQLNVLVGLEAAGHKVEKKRVERDGQRPVTRYYLKNK